MKMKINGYDVSTKRPCIVCGAMTNHRHSIESSTGDVPVCQDCCGRAGKIHAEVTTDNNFYCKRCDKYLPRSKCGLIMDGIYVCPDCQEPVTQITK